MGMNVLMGLIISDTCFHSPSMFSNALYNMYLDNVDYIS